MRDRNLESPDQEAWKQGELPLEGGTYNGPTVSRKNSTKTFCRNKKDVVASVAETLKTSLGDSRLTITIEPGRYEGSYALTVITD